MPAQASFALGQGGWIATLSLRRMSCRTFNALTGTPLARLRKKDKWLTYAQQMTEGQSVRKSARPATCIAIPRSAGVTAFSTCPIRSGRRCCLASPKPTKRSASNCLKARSARDRAGETADFVLARADKEPISAVLKPILATNVMASTLCRTSMLTTADSRNG